MDPSQLQRVSGRQTWEGISLTFISCFHKALLSLSKSDSDRWWKPSVFFSSSHSQAAIPLAEATFARMRTLMLLGREQSSWSLSGCGPIASTHRISLQLAGLRVAGNWTMYEKEVSIPGSALGVVYNYGKSLLAFASQFPTDTKRKWNLTLNHWLSSVRVVGIRY